MDNMPLKKLHRFLKKSPSCALLITSAANVRYISRFTGGDCWLIITGRRNFFIGDFRYKLQAEQELNSEFEFRMINKSIYSLIYDIARSEHIRSLYFEAKHLNFEQHDRIKNILGKKVKLIPTRDLIEKDRQIKKSEEIKLIQKAVFITKKSLRALKPFIKSGISEQFLKNKLLQILQKNGAEGIAFDIIVASGPNAAMPHARTTKRIIKTKEPVIVDVGIDFKGYKSDLTRTFFLGTITQYTKYYKHVAAAQDRAIKMVRPGVKIQDIDRRARQVLKKACLDRYFGHALGHGVGLEVHEKPYISAKNKKRLKKGMVFTIEPGVYIPNFGGIRIEDMVLVTDKGYKVL